MTKLFLDTNIVVDLLERREPFCHDAVRLFTMAYNRQVQLVVSPMTYSTASFLLRKHGSEGVRNLLSNFRQLSRIAAANERTVETRWPHSSRTSRMPCNTILLSVRKPMPSSLAMARTSLTQNFPL